MALGSIVVDLLMKTGQFEEGAANAERTAKRRAAAIDQAFADMGRNVAIAAGVAGTALVAMTAQMTQQANDIINLARVSGATTDEFQRMAAAAKTLGVDQDKLGDIFLDFRRKIGEFVQTGGGELKDFFEQVAGKAGVTAESFRDLSGPQALQLYITSLEKAGLSTEEMSFYLDSAASDADKLIPILQNGGAAAKTLGDEAAKTGRIMNDDLLKATQQLGKDMDTFKGILEGLRNEVMGAVLPSLNDMGGGFLKLAREVGFAQAALISFGGVVARTLNIDELGKLNKEATAARLNVASLGRQLDTALNMPFGMGESAAASIRAKMEAEMKRAGELSARIKALTGTGFAEPASVPNPFAGAPAAPATPGTGWSRPNVEPKAAKAGGKSAGAARVDEAVRDAENLKKALRTESEILMDSLVQYQGLLDKKLITQAEYGAAMDKLVADSPLFKLSPEFKDAEKEREALADRLLALRRELMTDEERNVDALRAQLDLIGKINDASERGQLTGRALGGATAPAPEFGGLAPEIGGPFGELGKIDQAEENLNEWYEKQLEMLKSFREERADLAASFDEEELALKAEHEAKLQLIESARQQAQLSAAASVFGNLADMTRQFAGEQSGIYKTMFALQKAAAIAQSIVAIQQGVAMAAANPWPLNLGAMASVAAATASIISTIASTNIQGARATGGPVSQNQTYLVGERGPELFVPNTNGAIVPNNKLNNGGGNITVNMIQNRERAGQTQERTDNGRREIDLFVADIMGDGPRAKAMRQAFGLQRRGY